MSFGNLAGVLLGIVAFLLRDGRAAPHVRLTLSPSLADVVWSGDVAPAVEQRNLYWTVRHSLLSVAAGRGYGRFVCCLILVFR